MTDYIEPINNLALDIRAGNMARGFWDDAVQVEAYGPDAAERALNVEKLALIGTEVSEAIEEIRSGHLVTETYENTSKRGKPEGVPSELADIVIRTLDFAGYHGIDIGQAIADKLAYNGTRGHRHGRVM